MPFSPSDVEPESSANSAEPYLLLASKEPSMVSVGPIPGPDPAARDQAGGAPARISNPTPIRLRDLAYAARLAGASERMLGQPSLASLWPVVAAEAARLIAAHAVAIVSYRTRDEWRLVTAHQYGRGPADPDIEPAIQAAALHGWLGERTYINDLGRSDGLFMTGRRLPDAGRGSLLVVCVARPYSEGQTRLVWFRVRLALSVGSSTWPRSSVGTSARPSGTLSAGRPLTTRSRLEAELARPWAS
jgi:hypothetical protein